VRVEVKQEKVDIQENQPEEYTFLVDIELEPCLEESQSSKPSRDDTIVRPPGFWKAIENGADYLPTPVLQEDPCLESEELPQCIVDKLKKLPCTKECTDDTGLTFIMVEISTQEVDLYNKVMKLLGSTDPAVGYIVPVGYPIVRRRALANSFRHYQNLYSRECDAFPAIPAHFGPGTPIPGGGLNYPYHSVVVLYKLLSRWQLAVGAPGVIPPIAGIAPGGFLGQATVFYANGHVVIIRSYR